MSGLGPWGFGIKDGDGGRGKGETRMEKDQKSHGVRDLVKVFISHTNGVREGQAMGTYRPVKEWDLSLPHSRAG